MRQLQSLSRDAYGWRKLCTDYVANMIEFAQPCLHMHMWDNNWWLIQQPKPVYNLKFKGQDPPINVLWHQYDKTENVCFKFRSIHADCIRLMRCPETTRDGIIPLHDCITYLEMNICAIKFLCFIIVS